jgi:TRAP-type C4-dicarboxylate transport system permease small subunit
VGRRGRFAAARQSAQEDVLQMIETLRRFDRQWARAEGWVIVGVLILMILVAGFAAGVRNLTRFDIEWASRLLNDMAWADSLLRKGTLWLAFVGGSLATYHRKHIIIDPLLRIAPARAKYTLLAISSILAGLITIALTYSFSSAVYLNLTERPVEYELLSNEGNSMHVCDASDERVDALVDLEKPTGFCLFRAALAGIGVPAETPGAAFQLIVPIMFFVMAIRMLGQGVGHIATLAGGAEAIARAEEVERAATEAQAQSFHKEDPPKS